MPRITDIEARRLLGVDGGASPAEVRTAFAAAVRQAHPDTSTGGPHPDVGALLAARDQLVRRPVAQERVAQERVAQERVAQEQVAPVYFYRRHALTSLARWWYRRRVRGHRIRR